MRLCFLCHGIGNGGAERVLLTLAEEFYKRNNKVCLVTTNPGKNDYSFDENIHHYVIVSKKSNAFLRTIERILMLRKVVLQFKPDCIVSFSAIPNMQIIAATIFLRKKIIVSERTDPSFYPTSRIGRFLRLLLYPLSNRVVFQTEMARNYFPRFITNKGEIILNPIRENMPQPWIGARENKIVGVGSLSEQKNWLVTLKACELFFREYPNYTLDVYGIGNEEKMLKQYVADHEILKEKVSFKGFSYDVIEKIRKAKMYVSSSKYEGISNAMLESLAVGTPTICSDCPVGGARMFINDGENGFLFPVDDERAMFQKMKILAENPEICEEFSRNSVKIRNRISLKKICNDWENLIVKICRN